MDGSPKYAPCEIEMAFGDGDYVFRLPLKQIAELQEKCKAGIGAIFTRVMSGQYYIEDCVETFRLGLIGGGTDPTKARVLMERYFDDLPVQAKWDFAIAILGRCVVPYEPPGEQPGKAGTAMTQADGSTSPSPTETEPSQAGTASETSTASPIGSTARSATVGPKSTRTKSRSRRARKTTSE
jgi:hypothetical protein